MAHLTMEAPMHGTFERSRETRDKDTRRSWDPGFLAIPTIIAVALVALMIAQPEASKWVSEAVQAEFAGSVVMPDAAPSQLAQPAGKARSASAY
jgi:hypothetical protein